MPQDGACGHRAPHRGGMTPIFYRRGNTDGSRETRILEFCLSRKPSRTGWDVSTTRTGYGYENAKANVMMDYKGWFIVRSRKVR